MILQVFILAAGFFLLVKGADWFVEGAAGIAKKMGIPQLVIGLTIVAMGTSMPEAAVSITAAFNHNAGITIGNIVGSNILNILIILGITAVITNVAIQKSTFRYEIPFMIGVTGVLLIFGVTGASITFAEGVIFWILFLGYLGYLFVMARKGNAGIAIGNIVGSNIFNILFVIGTTALICTVPFEEKFLIDTGIAAAVGVLLWAGTIRHKELRRPFGIVMLLCYVAYFVYLCVQ